MFYFVSNFAITRVCLFVETDRFFSAKKKGDLLYFFVGSTFEDMAD